MGGAVVVEESLVIVTGAVSSEMMAFTSSSRECFWLERERSSLRFEVSRSDDAAAAGDIFNCCIILEWAIGS